MEEPRPLRADAQRNRQRILEVATRVFVTEGLSISVQEIARRAGVGTGTVSRHFPTKESLFEAILRQRMGVLISLADDLLLQDDAGGAFFRFFEETVEAAGSDRGFAERLASAIDQHDSFQERISADALCDRLGALLDRAQRGGQVRSDLSLEDVEALLVACMTRPDRAALMSVVRKGLTG